MSDIAFYIKSNIHYINFVLLMSAGLYIIISTGNLMKKVIGLAIFQLSILMLFTSISKIENGIVPILKCMKYKDCPITYSNPLPHVLMLTAIVVGVAVTALGLALITKVKEEYGSIEEEKILNKFIDESDN